MRHVSKRLFSTRDCDELWQSQQLFPGSYRDKVHPQWTAACEAFLRKDFVSVGPALKAFFADATYDKGWDFGTCPSSGATKRLVLDATIMEHFSRRQEERDEEELWQMARALSLSKRGLEELTDRLAQYLHHAKD